MLVILGLVKNFAAAPLKDGQKPPTSSAKADATGRPGSDEFGAVSKASKQQANSEAARKVFGGSDRATTVRPRPSEGEVDR